MNETELLMVVANQAIQIHRLSIRAQKAEAELNALREAAKEPPEKSV